MKPIYADATVTNQAGGLIQGDTNSGIAVVGANASGHKAQDLLKFLLGCGLANS